MAERIHDGLVCAKGAEPGIETPANAAMTALVKRGELAPGIDTIAGL